MWQTYSYLRQNGTYSESLKVYHSQTTGAISYPVCRLRHCEQHDTVYLPYYLQNEYASSDTESSEEGAGQCCYGMQFCGAISVFCLQSESHDCAKTCFYLYPRPQGEVMDYLTTIFWSSLYRSSPFQDSRSIYCTRKHVLRVSPRICLILCVISVDFHISVLLTFVCMFLKRKIWSRDRKYGEDRKNSRHRSRSNQI